MKYMQHLDKIVQWFTEDKSAYQFLVGYSILLGFFAGVLVASCIGLLYIVLQ